MIDLPFSGHEGTIAEAVTRTRTGYTGDLGYEIWVDTPDATAVWDAVWDVADGYGVLPYGMGALYMLRIEAGLLLLGADFDSSRFAFNDAHRSTPLELGWAWMFKGLEDDDRPFIGRRALEREREEKTSAAEVDGGAGRLRAVYAGAGLIPPRASTVQEEGWSMTRSQGSVDQHMYSPVRQQTSRSRRATRPRQARQTTSYGVTWTNTTEGAAHVRGCHSTTRSVRPPDGP